MNTPEKPDQPQTAGISAEAMIGIGITLGSLGLLGFLLGWAQQMRSVPSVAFLWFVLGAVLITVGILVVVLANARKRRR